MQEKKGFQFKVLAVPALFLGLPLVFIGAFFFYPLVNIFRLSLNTAVFAQLLRPTYLEILWFTFWQATLSTLLTLLAGLPVAYVFTHFEFPAKNLLRALTTIPFVMPTVVVATAFRTLLGVNGPVNGILTAVFHLSSPPIRLEQTLTLILLAHVFYNLTVVVRLVGGFWANLNPRLGEAAHALGASGWQVWWRVTLPLLRPPLLSAALLIFLFTFTSFGVILILGGPGFSTIETEIYRQYVTFLKPDVAAALSLVQIAFTFVLMAIYSGWQRKTAVSLDFRPQQLNVHPPRTTLQKLFTAVVITTVFLFLLAPLLALIWRSLADSNGNFTLAYYQALPELRRGSVLFVPPLTAVRNSLLYALATVGLAGFLGVITAVLLTRRFSVLSTQYPVLRKQYSVNSEQYPISNLQSPIPLIHASRFTFHASRWLEPIFMLPLGASAVTLGFGYVVTYQWLRTSPLLVLIAHTLVAWPFVVRSLLPVLQGIKPNLREVAASLGASPWRVWREVDLPFMGRALLVSAVFAFTISMGEFGATSFIVRPNSGYLTLPIAIERYLGQPGALNFGQAVAMSTILMVVCAVGFIAIERFRYADIGEF